MIEQILELFGVKSVEVEHNCGFNVTVKYINGTFIMIGNAKSPKEGLSKAYEACLKNRMKL